MRTAFRAPYQTLINNSQTLQRAKSWLNEV